MAYRGIQDVLSWLRSLHNRMSLGSLQSVISRVDAPSVMIPLDAKLEGVALLPGVGEEDDDDRPVYENVGRRSRFDFSSLILLSHVMWDFFLTSWGTCSNRGIQATSP